jgi:hypothetical protein
MDRVQLCSLLSRCTPFGAQGLSAAIDPAQTCYDQLVGTEVNGMRSKRATLCLLAAFIACSAKYACAQVEVTVPEAGRVKTTAKVENGILGISNSFTRSRGIARECVGACFYATATKTRVWICRDSECNLDCSGREPVGGC